MGRRKGKRRGRKRRCDAAEEEAWSAERMALDMANDIADGDGAFLALYWYFLDVFREMEEEDRNRLNEPGAENDIGEELPF